MRDNDRDSQGGENVEFYSDQELTTDESSYEEKNRGLMIYSTRRSCGIQWTRRECHTYIDKTQLNSVRTVVQCGQKPTVGTQISVI